MAVVINDGGGTDLGASLGSLSAGDIVQITQNQPKYTAGLNLSGTDLAEIRVGPGYRHGLALTAQLNQTGTGRFVNETGATEPSSIQGASAATVIHRVIHTPQNAVAELTLGAANYEELISAGVAIVDGSADVANVLVLAGTTDLIAGAAQVTRAIVAAGELLIARDIQTLEICGRGNALVNHATNPNFTTTRLVGGRITWQLAPAQTGTLDFLAGVVDFSRLEGALDLSGATVTLGDPANLQIIYPASGKSLITWGSPTLKGRDPR